MTGIEPPSQSDKDAWTNDVPGIARRDEIEPPALWFSVTGPDVQQCGDSVFALLSWHVAGQA
jgi:hypothetical protein